MEKLTDYVQLIIGTSQFRIKESDSITAKTYYLYSQDDLYADLFHINNELNNKTIKTNDEVSIWGNGDIIFSLISGVATEIGEAHSGYLFSHNYVKLKPNENIDAKYLIYLLNENKTIKRQLKLGLQGSSVLKYTLKQLRELNIPKLPNINKQKIIGEIYLKQLHISALKKRISENELTIMLNNLREAK